MEDRLKLKLDKMISLYEYLRKEYKWNDDFMLRFTAFIYTVHDRAFDREQFDEMIEHMKTASARFSHYRSDQAFSIAALLINKYDNPKEAFNKQLKIEERLRTSGFKKSSYLCIASYALMLTAKEEDWNERIERAAEIYKGMKKDHFWLTGVDDYPVVILLAASPESSKNITNNMEECFNKLHEAGFSKSNGLQFLSQILTFVPKPTEDKIKACKDVFHYLKDNKVKIYYSYYGVIGFLEVLGDETMKAAEEVVEVYEYLRANKDFRWLGNDMNVLMATSLVCNEYVQNKVEEQALEEGLIATSIETLIAAQTAAIIAATTAATAAITSSAQY